MRPLWWHYPGFDEEQEHFLVGDSLLIAAVLEEGAVTQKLRLPSQELWYDVFGNDGRPYRKNTIQADLDRMVSSTPMDRALYRRENASDARNLLPLPCALFSVLHRHGRLSFNAEDRS